MLFRVEVGAAMPDGQWRKFPVVTELPSNAEALAYTLYPQMKQAIHTWNNQINTVEDNDGKKDFTLEEWQLLAEAGFNDAKFGYSYRRPGTFEGATYFTRQDKYYVWPDSDEWREITEAEWGEP